MAEICLDCWNKINESADSKKKYILSKDFDLCDGCGEWKPVIIMERKAYYMCKFRYFILPIRVIYRVLSFIWRLFLRPFFYLDIIKEEKDKF